MSDDTHANLRRTHLAARRCLHPDVHRELSRRITQRLLGVLASQAAQTLATYASINNEVDVSALWTERADLTHCLPAMMADSTLVFRRIDATSQLATGRFGIPTPQAAQCAVVALYDIDIVVVPLVVFDSDCQRIGMGGGYYDRTFATRRQGEQQRPLLIGAAYESQRTDKIIARSWDVRLDCVVTETQTYTY